MPQAPEKLKRQLGFWDSVAINVGIIIGVGIFRAPGQVAQFLDSPHWILFAWLVGGAVALFGVFCYAGLSSRFPETGGTYIFLREAYGKAIGFIFGWVEFAILRAGSIAAVSYIFTTYLRNFIPFEPGAERWITVLAVACFTVLNIIGLKVGAGVQNVLSSLKIIAILAIAGLIFSFVSSPAMSPPPQGAIWNPSYLSGIAPALIPILWSYGGWHQSTYLSGEFRDTKRALPLSLIASIGIVAFVYILINTAYLRVLTPAEMLQSKAIASDIFSRLFGPVGMSAVTAAVLISASGALNSTILTGGRIPFAVAQDYPRASWLAKVDPRFGTPLRSIVLTSLWASVLVLWGNFEQLLFFFAFANWFFFALVGISVFIIERKTRLAASAGSQPSTVFSVIGYPVIPFLFVLSSLWICATTIHEAPREALFGALLMLSGIPVYLLVRGGKKEATPEVIFNKSIVEG